MKKTNGNRPEGTRNKHLKIKEERKRKQAETL